MTDMNSHPNAKTEIHPQTCQCWACLDAQNPQQPNGPFIAWLIMMAFIWAMIGIGLNNLLVWLVSQP